MARYRKRPLVVEAEQWVPGRNVPGVCTCPQGGGPDLPHVHTTHKGQTALLAPGDWVVAEPNAPGRFYPVKSVDFDQIYEPVAEQ